MAFLVQWLLHKKILRHIPYFYCIVISPPPFKNDLALHLIFFRISSQFECFVPCMIKFSPIVLQKISSQNCEKVYSLADRRLYRTQTNNSNRSLESFTWIIGLGWLKYKKRQEWDISEKHQMDVMNVQNDVI